MGVDRQDGLLASTRDGHQWINNETVPERGDVYCVAWTGHEFLAPTSKALYASDDGLTWQVRDMKSPRQIRRIGAWLYG